jgi:hypothetical protein
MAKRLIKFPKLPRWIFIFAIVVMMIAAARFAWWYPRRPIEFNSAAWKSTTQPDFEPRYRMVSNLMNLMDQGKIASRDAVFNALGKPDNGTDANSSGSDYWLYNLGPEHNSMFRIDNDWLELMFDKSGHLLSHRVRPD